MLLLSAGTAALHLAMKLAGLDLYGQPEVGHGALEGKKVIASDMTCPTEILEAIASINAEGRPIWKPMHMQPIYRLNLFITKDGNGRARTNAYIEGNIEDVGMDIFDRGLCLPSENKMTAEQQDRVIEIIHKCFE